MSTNNNGSTQKKVGFSKDVVAKEDSKKKTMQQQQMQPLASSTQQRAKDVGRPATRGFAVNEQPGVFTKGQLTALIMVSLGVSRLMKLTLASGGSGDVDVCIDHLGSDACHDPTVRALLHYKNSSALQYTFLAVAVILRCWKSEFELLVLDATFLLAPVAPLAAVLLFCDGLQDGRNQNLVMAFVLLVLACPTAKELIPFVKRRRDIRYGHAKSLQTLCLVTLCMLSLYDGILQILIPLAIPQQYTDMLGGDDSSAGGRMPQPMERLLLFNSTTMSSNLNETDKTALTYSTKEDAFNNPTIRPAIDVILYLVVVDKISQALLYYFAWYYFPQKQQRTLLMMVGLMKGFEYYFQIPLLRQHFDLDGADMITLTIACACVLAWIAPDLKWNKSLSDATGATATSSKAAATTNTSVATSASSKATPTTKGRKKTKKI